MYKTLILKILRHNNRPVNTLKMKNSVKTPVFITIEHPGGNYELRIQSQALSADYSPFTIHD